MCSRGSGLAFGVPLAAGGGASPKSMSDEGTNIGTDDAVISEAD